MKAKLSKNREEYVLSVDKGTHQEVIGHSFEAGKYKLSKQNCDEIFGVVDVEKLAEEYGSKFAHSYDPEDFIEGFNKAMELNKDKVFTLEDMYYIFQLGFSLDGKAISKLEYDTHIQSLQQPTEIEVTFNPDEKDSEGCLILKRVV